MGLNALGLEAESKVEGTLLTKLVLRDLVIRGTSEENRTNLRADLIAVDYSWMALIREGLPAVTRSLRVERLKGTFDIAALPQKPDEEAKSSGEFPLDRLPQPEITVEDVDLTLLLKGAESIVIRDLQWHLSKDEEQSRGLRVARLELPGGRAMDDIALAMRYTDRGLQLADWQIHPKMRLETLEVFVIEGPVEAETGVAPDLLRLQGEVALYGARLGLDAVLNREARLEWREGSLDLAEVGEEWLPAAELSGEITQVTANLDNMGAALTEWAAEVHVEGNEWAYGQWTVAEVRLDATLENGQVTSVLAVDLDEANRLRLEAESALPAAVDVSDEENGVAARGRLSVTAPNLQGWIDQSGLPLRLTSVNGDFQFRYEGEALQTLEGELTAENVGNDDWRVPRVVLRSVPVTAEGADTPNQIRVLLTATAGPEEGVDGEILFRLNEMTYDGNVNADLENLARWQVPHPEREGWSPVEGSVRMKWNGQGVMQEPSHEGHVELVVANVAAADQPMEHQGELALDYTLEEIRLNTLTWRKDDFEFVAHGRYTPNGIRLPEIRVRKGSESWLEGHVFVPLAPEGSIDERFWGSGEALDVELHSATLELQRVAEVFAPERESLQGTVKIDITAKGPAANLVAEAQVAGRGLGASFPEDRPLSADVDLRAFVRDERLGVEGVIKQKDLQRLELTGGMPFSWQALDQIQSAPIDVWLRSDSTPLNFLTDYVPAITDVRGTLGIDVAVTGTVSEPAVNGMVDLDLPMLRLETRAVPEVRDARIHLESDGKRLDIQTFRATLAGGKVDLGGEVLFAEGEPTLDVRVRMDQAPLIRNEYMIVRANGDFRVSGPFATAAVGGVVTVVESRYFREFELLPTNPRSPSVPTAPREIQKYYGTEAEPYRDWTIDVKVRTPPDDPFRVRTNVAAIDVASDLNLLGTGNRVFPRGRLTIVDGYASLPFSQLDFGPSTITFDEASGFPGRLSITGRSTVQEYVISINVGGTLNDVQPLLVSSPPLPEEEIMTLLATGTTREALLGDENVAASRAAMLLFDKLWRKLNPDDELKDPQEMRERRLTVEPTQVDPRTGRQMSSARLRLTDKVSVSADADVEGDIRGLMHFLFRF